MYKITLKESVDNQVIREIVNPVVQLDLANDNIFLSGQEKLLLLDGQEVLMPNISIFNQPNFGFNPSGESEAEKTAREANTAAKEVAKQTALKAIKLAITKYAQSVFVLENPTV